MSPPLVDAFAQSLQADLLNMAERVKRATPDLELRVQLLTCVATMAFGMACGAAAELNPNLTPQQIGRLLATRIGESLVTPTGGKN